jgi:hypothetical protein
MAHLTGRFIDGWRRSPLSRHPRFPKVATMATRADVPAPLPRRMIIVVGTPPKWALLPCPCGTGHTINLNLANPKASRWHITEGPPATITPSIDVQDPTGRCHFWLRQGRVDWVLRPRSQFATP